MHFHPITAIHYLHSQRQRACAQCSRKLHSSHLSKKCRFDGRMECIHPNPVLKTARGGGWRFLRKLPLFSPNHHHPNTSVTWWLSKSGGWVCQTRARKKWSQLRNSQSVPDVAQRAAITGPSGVATSAKGCELRRWLAVLSAMTMICTQQGGGENAFEWLQVHETSFLAPKWADAKCN